MREFKWHLMSEEEPKEGKGIYVVMGPKGGVNIARGFDKSEWGDHFVVYHYSHIPVRNVYAWIQVPPFKEEA